MLKYLWNTIKNSKIFGISAIYFVALIFGALAIYGGYEFFDRKAEKEERANKLNAEINQMQDSALAQEFYITKETENGGRSIYLASDFEKLKALRENEEYKKKNAEAWKNSFASPTIGHKLFVWFGGMIASALSVTLVIFLMLHINIRKDFIHSAIKMAPWIYIANLITYALILLLLP